MRRRRQSFRHAFAGAATLLRSQPNARIHFVATTAAFALAAWLRVSAAEWCALLLAVALVWACEALNSALEFLADEVTLERRERIKHAKDVAAFAVLIASAAALGVGALIFLPRLF